MAKPSDLSKRPDKPKSQDEDVETIRRRLMLELKQEAYKEAEKKVTDDLRRIIRCEVQVELEQSFKERLPTPEEKDRALQTISKLRTDCLVRAQTASDVLDAERASEVRKIRTFRPITVLLVASILPSMYWLSTKGLSYSNLGWWATVVTLAFLACVAFGFSFTSVRYDNRSNNLQRAVGSYTNMAREFDTMSLSIGLKQSMYDLAGNIINAATRKDELDKNFHLSVRDIKKARAVVHEDKILETDPEEFLRIAHSELPESIPEEEVERDVQRLK